MPWATGMLLGATGVAGILGGAWILNEPLAIVSYVFLGAGFGLAYRTGLVTLTRGSEPTRQGALSSLYSAITYATGAGVILLAGWAGNSIGVVASSMSALVFALLVVLATTVWAPRLRDASMPR